MKNIKGLLLLDFTVQSILVASGIFILLLQVFSLGTIHPQNAFIIYLVLGGWQYLFSLLLCADFFQYKARLPYVKRISVLLGFVVFSMVLAYVGLGEGLLMAVMFFMLFVPPVIALYRYINAYLEVRELVDTDEKVVVQDFKPVK